MFAKLIDGKLQCAPKFFKINGNAVFTNSAETHLEHGYKEVVYSTPPENEGFYPVSKWVETETHVIQEWDLLPIENSEDGGSE